MNNKAESFKFFIPVPTQSQTILVGMATFLLIMAGVNPALVITPVLLYFILIYLDILRVRKNLRVPMVTSLMVAGSLYFAYGLYWRLGEEAPVWLVTVVVLGFLRAAYWMAKGK